MLKSLVNTLSIILVFTFVLVAAALGLGALLHWLLPVIDLGTATTILMIALSISTYGWVRMVSSPLSADELEDEFYEKPTIVLEQYPFRKSRSRKSKKNV